LTANPMNRSCVPPILDEMHYCEVSTFTPDNLLREARRQKGIGEARVPAVCVLDPDGDLVRRLASSGRAQLDASWSCYHTQLFRLSESGLELGFIGCAVGASFAVLFAEELFACGCKILISITSAGQLVELCPPPYFVLIERALRDEGTSYHYLPAAEFSSVNIEMLTAMKDAFAGLGVPVERGSVWTTDAPFRETASAIVARPKGFWRSRWRRPHSMLLPRLDKSRWSVSRM
jgi:phosphorylase superfamily protein